MGAINYQRVRSSRTISNFQNLFADQDVRVSSNTSSRIHHNTGFRSSIGSRSIIDSCLDRGFDKTRRSRRLADAQRGDGVVRVLLVVVFSESRSRSALRLRLVMCCEHTIPRRRGALCRRRLDKRRPGHRDNGTTTTTNRTLVRTSRRLRPPAPHALHDLERRDGAAPL